MSGENILAKRRLEANDDNCQVKKVRVDTCSLGDMPTGAGRQQTIKELESSRLQNLLAFLSHMDASLLRGCEGRYVVVSNGRVWLTSFDCAEDALAAASAARLPGENEASQVYLVPRVW
jgi:hypothetical protein